MGGVMITVQTLIKLLQIRDLAVHSSKYVYHYYPC